MITLFIGVQTVCVGVTTVMAFRAVKASRSRRKATLKLVQKHDNGMKHYRPL